MLFSLSIFISIWILHKNQPCQSLFSYSCL
jgi:hypothetical protein